MNYKHLIFYLSLSFLISCNDEEEIKPLSTNKSLLKSVPTKVFNWENVDWMPTPANQSPISVPWIGQGSIADLYSLDVVNDYKMINGWVLLYNTFSNQGISALENPYFILYNKYRGIMRIYTYITTPFVTTSTHLNDGLFLNSNHSSSIFNFMGADLIDGSERKSAYKQVQPKTLTGSAPVASNRWYMVEYELAYDDNLKNIPYNEQLLVWYLGYSNISQVTLNGNINGKIESASGSKGNLLDEILEVGEKFGIVAISGFGKNFLNNKLTNGSTGENKFNIPGDIYNDAIKGLSKGVSGGINSIPGSIMNFFSAMIGGSSDKPVKLNFNAEMELSGDISTYGALPGSPCSFYVPGTIIPISAPGYIPAYNSSLGVFNFDFKPNYKLQGSVTEWYFDDALEDVDYNFTFRKESYKQYLKFNPKLLEIANVEINEDFLIWWSSPLNQNLLWTSENVINYGKVYVNAVPETIRYSTIGYVGTNDETPHFAVRFKIKISPKDGSVPVLIQKTFDIEADYSDVRIRKKELR
ncbi:hypothetical protein [Labilibaculum euxinus]